MTDLVRQKRFRFLSCGSEVRCFISKTDPLGTVSLLQISSLTGEVAAWRSARAGQARPPSDSGRTACEDENISRRSVWPPIYLRSGRASMSSLIESMAQVDTPRSHTSHATASSRQLACNAPTSDQPNLHTKSTGLPWENRKFDTFGPTWHIQQSLGNLSIH